ncbi:MAG: hypothetical protein QOI58_2650 [Thermoanaerobaculia bacterium]|jgi:hypothetical protein|nr:hypothetical protein [Thermoanaerobaculia bacterium]
MNPGRLVVLLFALVITSTAGAAEVMRGDVVSTSDTRVIMCPAPPRTAVLSPNLEWKSWLYSGDAVAFDSIGTLYAAGDRTLESFDSTLRDIRTVVLGENVIGLAVDSAGFAYVVGQSGKTYVISPGGVFQRTFRLPNLTVPVGAISIDVTPDGCTLVYVGDGASANRFNTCAQVALVPIAPGERFEAIRALSDGGFAGATDGRIKFYDSTGRVIYGILAPPGGRVAALSFDIDGQSLWIANETFLVRMNIIDQTITARTPVSNPRTIAVFGERRISAANLPAAAPTRRHSAGH